VPICKLQVKVKVAGRMEEPQAHLETVILEPDDDRLCLVWRAAVPCDKQALKIEEIAVNIGQLLLGGRAA
jgi:hypothetical protein